MNRHQVKCHGDRITGGVISSRHQKAEEILEIGKRQALFSRNNTAQHTLRIYRLLTRKDGFRIVIKVSPGRRSERHEAVGVTVHLVDHMVGEIRIGVANQGIALFDKPFKVGVR